MSACLHYLFFSSNLFGLVNIRLTFFSEFSFLAVVACVDQYLGIYWNCCIWKSEYDHFISTQKSE